MDTPPPMSSNLIDVVPPPPPTSNLMDEPNSGTTPTQPTNNTNQIESWKRVWTISELRQSSEKWTLASDCGVKKKNENNTLFLTPFFTRNSF